MDELTRNLLENSSIEEIYDMIVRQSNAFQRV